MKNFERPEIIDTFENAEGVYLASGSHHEEHKEETDIDYTFEHGVNNHDSGSHTEYYMDIYLRLPKRRWLDFTIDVGVKSLSEKLLKIQDTEVCGSFQKFKIDNTSNSFKLDFSFECNETEHIHIQFTNLKFEVTGVRSGTSFGDRRDARTGIAAVNEANEIFLPQVYVRPTGL